MKQFIFRAAAIGIGLTLGLGALAGYAHLNSAESTIEKYYRAYTEGDVEAYKALCSESYKNTDQYGDHTSFFQRGAEVEINFSDPDVEYAYKKNTGSVILRNVPFQIRRDGSLIRVRRDISLKRTSAFKHEVDLEEYTPFGRKATGNVSSREIELGQHIQEEVEKNVPREFQPDPEELVKQISALIQRWKVAWVTKDLETYMDLYSDSAIVKRVTVDKFGNETRENILSKSKLRSRMEYLNERYESIFVEVYDPQVEIRSRNGTPYTELKIEAKFQQLYSGRSRVLRYADYGFKTMRFRLEDGVWKIVEESWEPRTAEMKKLREDLPEWFQD